MTDPAHGTAETARVDRALDSPDAFWALVEPHDAGLRRLAYRLLGDADLMDDVLQDAYIKAFRALPRFRRDAAVGTWLYRVVYNASIDELRRADRRRYVPLDAVGPTRDPSPDPADVATRRSDLVAALDSLPVDMRAAVLLVDAEGMDYQAAADVLGIAVGTVASRLNRARRHLRRALGEHTEGGHQ